MDTLKSSCLAASLLAATSFVHAEPAPTTVPATPPVVLPAAQAIEHGVAYRDVRYGDASRRGNLLDLYLPAHATGRTPLIVYIHGGGWIGGDKSQFAGGVSQVLQLGYAVASINYRLTDEAVFPAQIYDCKGAIRFLRSLADRFNLDADHIAVWGDSAGGHLAALLGTTADEPALEGTVGGNAGVSSRVQAVVDWFGPTDLNHIVDQLDPKTVPPVMKQEPTLLTRLLGGKLADKETLAREASPLAHITANAAPFLIMHGDQDPLVPLQQSQSLDQALRAAGVESDLIVVRGAGHGGAGFFSPGNLMAMAGFFSMHLKAD